MSRALVAGACVAQAIEGHAARAWGRATDRDALEAVAEIRATLGR